MTTDPTQRFSGYQVLAQLGQTPGSSVYRARADGQTDTVIIKVIRLADPSAEQMARFQYEFELVRGLEMDGIVQPIELIHCDGMPAMVLEDFGGVSLKQLIADGMALKQFLKLAVRLADILGALHSNNVSHRDIKPSNILWNPDKDILKITDFGISEIIPINGTLANPNLTEGSLAYISPEQTGRMNCGMDYRTDLYSLGITFFEMLTGTVPFSSTDPLEMIHAHIAKRPPSIRELKPDIPGPVADIVMKMLSKPAAERYQNSLGLSADLQECLRQLQRTGRIEPFELGAGDISLRFTIPHLLVGRKEEVEALFSSFERISHGPAETILVSGDPGIGKSALVHEIHKPIVAKRGYFLNGKFDQFHRSEPYSAIIQAFRSLIKQLLSESNEQLQRRKQALLDALGPNGKVIADVIPEIELIIGHPAEVPELGPEKTRNRFHLVFKNFVHVFADSGHPLVLFLDDLQWADSASINLIQTILMDGNLRHVLFIGAFRDNEVADHHPLTPARQAMEADGRAIRTIHLGPLEPEQINQLLVSMTGGPPDTSLPLARLVHDKTQGSPFFIQQFLKTLYDKGYFGLETGRGWNWDLDRIRSMPATDNVAAFMAQRLHELPASTLDLLKLCACIGNQFDVELLTLLTGRSRSQIYPVMDALAQTELIVREGDIYRFYHDRIQEAAYSLLSQAEKESWHYRIGTLELERTSSEQLFNQVFYICDHLNQAVTRIDTPGEKMRLARLNLTAGIKAKESTAYAAAVHYLVMGGTLLPEDVWTTDYELAYELSAHQMQCQYLNQNFQEAERLFSIVIANAKRKVDLARAYRAMILLYTNTRPAPQTIKLGIEALKILGVHCNKNMGKGPVVVELIKAKRRLKKIGVENILDLPAMQDRALIVLNELMLALCTSAYSVNPNLFAWLSLKSVNASLKHGLMPHSSLAFINMANIIQTATGDYELAFRIGETALKLNQRFNNLKIAGVLHHIFAFFIFHWKRHLKLEWDIYAKALELSFNAGDFLYAGHSLIVGANTRLMMGHRLDDVLDDLNRHEKILSFVKDPVLLIEYRHCRQTIRALKGETPLRHDISDEGFDHDQLYAQVKAGGNLFGRVYFLFSKLLMLVLYKRFEEACTVATELDRLIKVPMGTIVVADHHFYHSLVLLALLKAGRSPVKDAMRLVRRNQRKLLKWAAACPENFRHQYEFIAAELAGLQGRFHTAVRLYHAAIADAHKYEFFTVEALACEYLGDFYLVHHLEEEAGAFFRRAHGIHTTRGLKVKADDLQANYPAFFPPMVQEASADQGSGTTTGTASRQLDYATVIKVSHLISSEIMLERLLAQIMQISIANAGAQRGYLILEADGRLSVQASRAVDTGEEQVLQNLPMETCAGLSPAIANYVCHSGEPVILGNATVEGPFVNDPHVVAHGCKSVLCIPILNKGKVMGLLYMENTLVADVFTPDRVEILGVIAAQAAISLQNARLYSEISSQMAIRKQAEEALRSSEKRLLQAQKMEAIGTLAGGIAHDFNNILSAILGYTELAIMKIQPDAKLAKYLKEVLIAAQRAKELVRQILTFARQSDEKLEPILVSTIAKEALKLIRSSIPTTIEIQSNILSNAPILGNPTQVHQIIMNLCANAAQAMEKDGGVLTLHLSETDIGPTNDLTLAAGKYLELIVADTGCGIPAQIMNSIFEPYFTTKSLGEGTGMGLSVVQGIVEKYGGKIAVHSQLGKGTTFTVVLPIVAKEATAPAMAIDPQPARNEKILFVDDEVSIADINANILRQLGYQVTPQTSSLDALRLFSARPEQFDLVVTDMTMPKMTGDQLAKEILRIRPDMPIVLCTGYTKQINEASALAMGIKALVFKPLNSKDLATTVRKALDGAAGR